MDGFINTVMSLLLVSCIANSINYDRLIFIYVYIIFYACVCCLDMAKPEAFFTFFDHPWVHIPPTTSLIRRGSRRQPRPHPHSVPSGREVRP
jgi:hypothetical protein